MSKMQNAAKEEYEHLEESIARLIDSVHATGDKELSDMVARMSELLNVLPNRKIGDAQCGELENLYNHAKAIAKDRDYRAVQLYLRSLLTSMNYFVDARERDWLLGLETESKGIN